MNGALGFHDFGCVVRPHVNRTLSLVLWGHPLVRTKPKQKDPALFR
jgi:hypothetical protein